MLVQWARLRRWAAEERSRTGQRVLLAAAAQQWRGNAPGPQGLWGGGLLRQGGNYPGLGPLESEFVIASQAARAREEKRRRQLMYLALVTVALIAILLVVCLCFLVWALNSTENAFNLEKEAHQKDIQLKEQETTLRKRA